mgnify:CR=1 FL=1
MFDLYDIFDDNEINVILLSVFVIILLIIIIGLAYYDYNMRQKLIKVEKELKNVSDTLDLNLNNNMFSDISNTSTIGSNSDESYKQKYEELLKEKDTQPNPMQYSPSEYATLLKYNPILPYSAFTMDIINNAYLDMNERGMYEDRYFALSNYDNIYDTTNNNNNNNNNNNSKLSSEEQDIINMAKLDEQQNQDNPNMQSTNSINSVQPNSNSKQPDF